MQLGYLQLAGLLLCSAGVNAIQAVSRAGRYLYNADGSRFYIKGVAYQGQGDVVASADNTFLSPSTFTDPLANATTCARDLPTLQQLGVNTLRVYSVNNSLNHDSCMQVLSNAGIYTIIDLSIPLNGSIDVTSPAWTTNLLDLYIDTIDAFAKYDNVLAFNVGNEVVQQNTTFVAPYIKAAARDVKAYLTSKSMTTLVGYASIDADPNWRFANADYLSCDLSGTNSGATAIDLYGLNNYEWCGNSSIAVYSGVEGQFADYNIPAYFSEFGCVSAGTPRPWTEVGALLSIQMSSIWSGGIAFSFYPATSPAGQFGMVTVSADGSSISTGQDFANLQAQYAAASPPDVPTMANAGSTSYGSCPAENSTFDASLTLPPTPNDAACTCLMQNLPCVFSFETNNYTAIVGELIGTACGLLANEGGNCDQIASNGSTGTYGTVAGCDPTVKLSFAMSQHYLANNNNPQACSFNGNGTTNPQAPTSVSAANVAASSCLSNATSTFTPTAPAGGNNASASGSSSAGSDSSSGASTLFGDSRALFGLATMGAAVVLSAAWTLL